MKKNGFLTLLVAFSVLFTGIAIAADENILVIPAPKAEKALTDALQKYPVFNRQMACKGNEAHRKLKITPQRLRSASFLITAHNGDYQFSDVKFSVNNQTFFPLRGLGGGQTRRVNLPISVDLLQNQMNRDILLVCYLDNFNSSSWVTVDLQIDTDAYAGNYNPTYPGNNGGTYNPTYPGNNGGNYNPTYPGNNGGYNPPYPGGNNNPTYPGNNGGNYNPNHPGNHGGGHHGGGSYGSYTAEEYIRMAERESSYSTADGILIDGSKRINTINGILKLAKAAYYASNTKTILSVLEDRSRTFYDMPEMALVQETYNSINQYSAADYLLTALSTRLVSVRKIMRLSAMAYYKESARTVMSRLDNIQLHEAIELPAFEGIRKVWTAMTSYSVADEMLIKIARFIREGRILDQMMEIAYYSETRRVLRKMRDDYYGIGNNHGGYNHGGYRAKTNSTEVSIQAIVEKAVETKNPEVDKELYSEFLKIIESDQSGFEFSLNDIEDLNMEKIKSFTDTLKQEKIKPSTLLNNLKEKLIEKLQFESTQNNNEEAKNILQAIIIE